MFKIFNIKYITLVFSFLIFGVNMQAQRVAYVNSEAILDQMPEYKSAQKQLDDIAAEWEKEIQTKKDSISFLVSNLNSEKILLSEEMIAERKKDIEKKQEELKQFQISKFGYEGELFRKRSELVKPIQDKVFDAINKVAKDNALDIIFDKATVTILYNNPKFDKTSNVLEELGIQIGSGNGVTPEEEPIEEDEE